MVCSLARSCSSFVACPSVDSIVGRHDQCAVFRLPIFTCSTSNSPSTRRCWVYTMCSPCSRPVRHPLCGSRLYLRATIHIDVHGSSALVLPRLGLVLSDVSEVLRVRLARPVEHCMCIAARWALRAVCFQAITSAVTLGADRASDEASARCLLVPVPVAVVVWTAVFLTMKGE
jgi:hypothetical protein